MSSERLDLLEVEEPRPLCDCRVLHTELGGGGGGGGGGVGVRHRNLKGVYISDIWQKRGCGIQEETETMICEIGGRWER